MRKIPCLLVIYNEEAFEGMSDDEVIEDIIPDKWFNLTAINPTLIEELREQIRWGELTLSTEKPFNSDAIIVLSVEEAKQITGDGIH